MQIESSRLSTHENEQVIAWYRATGVEIRTATSDPLEYLVPAAQGNRIPTDAISTHSTNPRPYAVLIGRLGTRRTDFGED